MTFKAEIEKIVQPVVSSFDFELVGVELIESTRFTIRVYIDAERGVLVDDCAKLSRQISSVLDVEDVVKKAYFLEVSSPGLERPLFGLSDFKKFLKKLVVVKFHSSINGRRKITGVISSVEGEQVHLVEQGNDSVEHIINIVDVKKANLVYTI